MRKNSRNVGNKIISKQKIPHIAKDFTCSTGGARASIDTAKGACLKNLETPKIAVMFV